MPVPDPLKRLLPDRDFPPYAFVPGQHPHPVTDPAGHSFGEHDSVPETPPQKLVESTDFRFGIDLFNFGYYWEAHEEWEGLWHALGRSGKTADLLKGLIRLAAAGVKAREGNPRGVRRHAERARELFEKVEAAFLKQLADEVAGSPPCDAEPTTTGKAVFDFRLTPDAFTDF